MIFVFGSNEGGHHGLGAAKTARLKHGYPMGLAFGLAGNAFGIPTKDRTIRRTLTVEEIRYYVDSFIQYARQRQDLTFQVTRIGCGLAGHRDQDIAPLFEKAPANCQFDTAWAPYLGSQRAYWGHVG